VPARVAIHTVAWLGSLKSTSEFDMPSSKLDPRFRALEAIPDRDPFGGPPVQAPIYRAIVLLAPGARRGIRGGPNAVDLLDDTFIAEGKLDDLRLLAAQPDVLYIEAPRTAVPDLIDSVAAINAHANPGPAGMLTGRKVIVGIIDDGLDFTHGDFQDPNGTRVLYLWDQTLTPQASEASPAAFSYGVEYTQADINGALAVPNPIGVVRHMAQAHGTHVAGIAAGNGRGGPNPMVNYRGVAYEADIVFVGVAQRGVNVSSSDRIAEAIKYVLDIGQLEDKPAVVNLSMGHNGGRHDGESVVERAVDRLLEREGCAFVKSAGNESMWGTHASGVVASVATPYSLTWIFHPRDRTPNELEIWYSSRDRFRVEVGDPAGNLSATVDPGNELTAVLSSRVYIHSERFHPLSGHARILVRVGNLPPAPAVTPGNWEIRITALDLVEGDFDAWIELDLRDPLNNNEDQSQFVSPDANKSITPPGTIRRGIAVANYNHRALPPAVAANSSRGPTGDGRLKPELTAPGTLIMSSKAGAGAALPQHVAMSGTSMSAPHVSGAVAQILQREPTLTAAQVRAILIASALQPGLPAAAAYDVMWGYGVIDAVEAVRLIP